MKQWSWLKGGIALGLLSIVAVFLVQPLGASTEYVIADGMLLRRIAPEFIMQNSYFARYAKSLSFGYGMAVVVGLLIGGFLSVLTGGIKVTNSERIVPSLWNNRFGYRPNQRYLHAFAGGFLILFGARLADGCTSGHIISGITQLAVSGVIFAVGVFASGIVTAKLLYSGKEGI